MGLIGILFALIFSEVALASDDDRLHDYREYWRGKYLQESSRVQGGLYVDYQGKNTTCSEAQGYGMLITVLMSHGPKDVRSKREFDALNRFQRAFRSNIDNRLMAWKVDDRSTVPVNTTCATDGDMDIAYALLKAEETWGDKAYLQQARQIISAMEESLIREDFSLRRGDWDKAQHAVRLSDIMPTHFRAFGRVSDNEKWSQVAKVHYSILFETIGPHGVFPDFVVKRSTKWDAAPPNYFESKYDGMMYYNSCRVPWRLGWASLEHDDEQAKRLLSLFDRGIGKVTNRDFKAGYNRDGEPIHPWTDGAFTAPHMCSLLVATREADYHQAVEYQLHQREGYYQDSIRLLALHVCFTNSKLER